jgi:hypothetical protein
MINSAFSILNLLDGWLAGWLPGLVRICMWGGMCGTVALAIYSALSDQTAIGQLKREARELRHRMLDPDLARSEFMDLVRRNLAVSFRLLGKTAFPALLSAFPVIVVASWLSAYQSYALTPDNTPVEVEISPNTEGVTLAPSRAFVRDARKIKVIAVEESLPLRFIVDGKVAYHGTPLHPPSGRVQKKVWWNALVGSEVGYIDSDSALEEIRFRFPRKVFTDGLPKWMATWELPFFLCLAVFAVSIKFVFRID